MRQRGNKNLSFPPAFRDLSEKLLVKYSQLLTIAGTGGPGQGQLLPLYVESKSQSKMILFRREEVLFFPN